MFFATKLPGKPMVWSNISPPFPSVPGSGGAANLFQSRVLWQSMQTATWLAKYSPRAKRSGVSSTCRSLGTGMSGRACVM